MRESGDEWVKRTLQKFKDETPEEQAIIRTLPDPESQYWQWLTLAELKSIDPKKVRSAELTYLSIRRGTFCNPPWNSFKI